MEESIAYAVGALALALVVLFSLADAALSEISWLVLEKKLRDEDKIRRFAESKVRIGISVKILIVAFNAIFAVSAFLVVRCRAPGDASVFFGAAGVIVSALLLCDMVPDLLGRRNPDAVVAGLLPLLHFVDKAARPATAVLYWISEVFARILGLAKPSASPDEQIHQELMSAVMEAKHGGVFADGEDRMIKSIIEFSRIQISEIMTPRTDVYAIQADTPVDAAVKLCFEYGHSRVPLFRENLDDITGVLYVKDLLQHWGDPASKTMRASEIAREPIFVPETKLVGDLLIEFKKEKVHIAVVMDEYGGTAGIITIEDIIEEIIGEIEDEYDEKEPDMIDIASDGSAVVDARINVYELNEALGISIPEGESYDTISGFIFSQIGRIPGTGENIVYGGLTFTILDADQRKIIRVKIVKSGVEE